jgi:hypothetical protein
MYKSVFLGFTDSNLIVLGFLLFMITFLGAFIWTIFIQEKSFYNQLAALPLQEGEHHGIE